jgi:hypothetical protein
MRRGASVGREHVGLFFTVSFSKMDLVAQYKDEPIPRQIEVGECRNLTWNAMSKRLNRM